MTVVNRSDTELIAATQTGDKQAFGQLIERHLPATRQVALQFVADSDLAWELAQETALQAYLALSTLRDPERFRYWLNGITRNVCRNYLRRRKNHLPTVATWFSSSDEDGAAISLREPDPHDLVEARELHRLVQVAIDALSPKNRATFRFFANILEKLGGTVEEVRIEVLKDITYFATVKVRNGKQVHEVDARPSDAIALALQTSSPIFVSPELMTQAGVDLPQPFDEQAWLQAETQILSAAGAMTNLWQQKFKEEPTLFAPDAQRVLQKAQQIALSYQHNYIGTEHLLLGLVSDKAEEMAQWLNSFGISLDPVSTTLERLVGRGATMPVEEPRMAPRVGQVLAFASAEAQSAGQTPINTRHLLTGLLREGHGMGLKIVCDLGVEPFVLWRKLKDTQ